MKFIGYTKRHLTLNDKPLRVHAFVYWALYKWWKPKSTDYFHYLKYRVYKDKGHLMSFTTFHRTGVQLDDGSILREKRGHD